MALCAARADAKDGKDLKTRMRQIFEVSRQAYQGNLKTPASGAQLLQFADDVRMAAGTEMGLSRKATFKELRTELKLRGGEELWNTIDGLQTVRCFPAHPTADLVKQVSCCLHQPALIPRASGTTAYFSFTVADKEEKNETAGIKKAAEGERAEQVDKNQPVANEKVAEGDELSQCLIGDWSSTKNLTIKAIDLHQGSCYVSFSEDCSQFTRIDTQRGSASVDEFGMTECTSNEVHWYRDKSELIDEKEIVWRRPACGQREQHS